MNSVAPVRVTQMLNIHMPSWNGCDLYLGVLTRRGDGHYLHTEPVDRQTGRVNDELVTPVEHRSQKRSGNIPLNTRHKIVLDVRYFCPGINGSFLSSTRNPAQPRGLRPNGCNRSTARALIDAAFRSTAWFFFGRASATRAGRTPEADGCCLVGAPAVRFWRLRASRGWSAGCPPQPGSAFGGWAGLVRRLPVARPAVGASVGAG